MNSKSGGFQIKGWGTAGLAVAAVLMLGYFISIKNSNININPEGHGGNQHINITDINKN